MEESAGLEIRATYGELPRFDGNGPRLILRGLGPYRDTVDLFTQVKPVILSLAVGPSDPLLAGDNGIAWSG